MKVTKLKRTAICTLFVYLCLWASECFCDTEQSGKEIYIAQCADCHGESGEGVSGAYEEPLTGDLSIQQLIRLIDRTMPEEAAEECTGKNAESVARYIHGEFYSEIAQARNSPPALPSKI